MSTLLQNLTQDEADARIAALQDMSVNQLRREWVILFGNHPYTTRNRTFLIKRLTWRIKTLLNGGLTERALKRAEEIADETLIRMKPREFREVQQVVHSDLPTNTPIENMPPGTIISRTYKGKKYEVTVLGKNRYAFNGKIYNNITAIAWEICGYRKSGNLFFNLPMTPRSQNADEA